MREKIYIHHAALLFLVVYVISCSTVPVTGRRQLNILPDSMIHSMSFQSYNEFLASHKLSDNAEQAEMVKEVGTKIQHAVEEYFRSKNMSSRLAGYSWEFKLVEDDAVNAWCMPGGKVVVYNGIMPIAKNEKGLAVVIGHEIAHAVANHGNERMSQGLITDMGGLALSEALQSYPDQTRSLFMLSYGVGSQVGLLLPYSRLHESEADRLGLIFMAMAGYDPRVAVSFWERMADLKKSGASFEFLSTHPSDEKRIANIKSLIPEAMHYYQEP